MLLYVRLRDTLRLTILIIQMVTFENLGLNPMIQRALDEVGFENPTPIQCKTIPRLISSKRDLIALAQTGTGKTAAFSLPIIQQIEEEDKNVQALVLCPTRELAMQIANDIKNFIKHLGKIGVTPVFGGERMDKQIRGLKKNSQIVVGTPGRINDMIGRGILKVNRIKWLVLDEADEMLKMGFKEELDRILTTTPNNKQVLLFSATMCKSIRRIADNYMKDPEDILIGTQNTGAKNIEHLYYTVQEKDRYSALKRIADMSPEIHGIVFCRTRRETQEVADKLIKDNYSAEAIHGEISQEQRTKVMNRFRKKHTQLLVATDVAARGIDVSGLTHIINYNLPDSPESYVHRSGRTGRANKTGISLAIINTKEQYKIKDIERKLGKNFEKKKIPAGKDVCEKQLFTLIERISKTEINESQLGKYTNMLSEKFNHIKKEELIKKFISIEFNRFLENYKNAEDLNPIAIKQDYAHKQNSSRRNFQGKRRRFSRFNNKKRR